MDQIFDYEKFLQEYGEVSEMAFSNIVEKMNEDTEALIEGIMQQDWVKVYKADDSLKGTAKYLYAHRLVEVTRPLQRFLLQYRKPHTTETPISFKESLNDEVKLQAMDFIIPIFEELRSLKLEMSKCRKSEVPNNYLLKEMEQIRQLHEKMKKEYQKKQSESQANISVITKLDKPEDASCTEKCIIF